MVCFLEAVCFWLINHINSCILFFSFRGWLNSKYFSLAGHNVSVTTTQLSHYGAEATTDNTSMNDYGFVPIKLYLLKARGGPELACML